MSALLRSAALFLSFAFGVIGMSVGINALVKSNDLKDFVRENAPAGVTVDIDTSEAFDPGAVLTVGCGLLALTSLLTFPLTFLRPRARKSHLGSSFLHFFWAVWIFASLVAYDVIARNRDAKVAAFLGSQQLPDSIVQQQEQALGVSRRYWDHDYIKLLAILPWFAFLFAVITGAVLLRASAKDGVSTAAVDASEAGGLRGDEGKPSTEKRESVESPTSPTRT